MAFYFISVGGLILCNVANFIKYLKFGWFKNSAINQIRMELTSIDSIMDNTGEMIALGIVTISIICMMVALLFGIFAKAQKALIFLLISMLVFFAVSDAWIHYIGFAIALVGLIGYMVAKKIVKV